VVVSLLILCVVGAATGSFDSPVLNFIAAAGTWLPHYWMIVLPTYRAISLKRRLDYRSTTLSTESVHTKEIIDFSKPLHKLYTHEVFNLVLTTPHLCKRLYGYSLRSHDTENLLFLADYVDAKDSKDVENTKESKDKKKQQLACLYRKYLIANISELELNIPSILRDEVQSKINHGSLLVEDFAKVHKAVLDNIFSNVFLTYLKCNGVEPEVEMNSNGSLENIIAAIGSAPITSVSESSRRRASAHISKSVLMEEIALFSVLK
jgi:hypothetical protein